jgi:hypothetical protein
MTSNKLGAMPIGIGFDGRPERPMAYEFLEETHVVR